MGKRKNEKLYECGIRTEPLTHLAKVMLLDHYSAPSYVNQCRGRPIVTVVMVALASGTHWTFELQCSNFHTKYPHLFKAPIRSSTRISQPLRDDVKYMVSLCYKFTVWPWVKVQILYLTAKTTPLQVTSHQFQYSN